MSLSLSPFHGSFLPFFPPSPVSLYLFFFRFTVVLLSLSSNHLTCFYNRCGHGTSFLPSFLPPFLSLLPSFLFISRFSLSSSLILVVLLFFAFPISRVRPNLNLGTGLIQQRWKTGKPANPPFQGRTPMDTTTSQMREEREFSPL